MVKLGMDDNMSTNSNDIGTDNLVDGMRNGNGSEDKVPKVQYTIPGVLHYVQHEWAKFEMERSQWEVERAELQARIAFLQGERKGQENLKNDLVRRIKMLEYALKQERLKNHRLLHGSSADVDLTDQAVTDETNSVMQLPSDTDAITTQPNSNTYWREGRQLLRKYLEEIGFTDTILDVRSYRVRSLLGLKSDGSESNINGRQLLRDSSGNIIEARQLRDVVTSEHPVLSSMNFGGNVNNQILANKTPSSKLIADHDSDNEEDITTAVNKPARKSSTKQDYCAEEEEALAEFQFLTCNDALRLTSATNASKKELHPSSGEEWGVDYSALNKKKEMYQKEAMTKKGASHSRLPRAELQAMITALNEDQQSPISKQQSGGQQQNFDNKTPPANTTTTTINPLNAAVNRNALYYPGSEVKSSTDRLTLGELSALSGVDEADPVTHSVNVPLNDTCKTWSARYTLRSHFDTVRCIAFHPVEPILLTASEDATLKMWNLQQPQSPPTPMSPGSASVSPQSQRAASGDSPGSSTSSNGKKQAQHELEPTHTFRGHSGPILCMCISPTGEYAYTGGLEGIVRCWTLPPVNVDLYDPYDPSLLVDTLRGHTDAVWSVAFHSSDNRLISASSDGTLKLWEPGSAHPLSKTYVANDSEGVPTSVDFVSTDPQQAIAAFSSSNAFIYDLEIGKSVLNFENNYGSCGRINQLISHPTLPITITAHEDRRIRFFDNNTGKTIDSVLAHLDSVSCLAIDPNGLYLLSGSHDSSLRLWNLDSKSCIQEITAHRRKFDESVMAVAFHPSRPYIASGGTDGCAKVFV